MSPHLNPDNMYCGAVRRGDIFLSAEGPGKERTVIALQDTVLNEGLPTVVCAVVEPYQSGDDVFANEVLLKKDEIGLSEDGLCMLHKLVTVDRRCMVEKTGALSGERLQQVYEALDITLGRFRDRL